MYLHDAGVMALDVCLKGVMPLFHDLAYCLPHWWYVPAQANLMKRILPSDLAISEPSPTLDEVDMTTCAF